MAEKKLTQWPISVLEDDFLLIWIDAFLVDRRAQNFSKGTLYFYEKKLQLFTRYCDSQAITRIRQITPSTIRYYLFWLSETGHNEGGIHACYRSLKTFLRWWEMETEPEGWSNPIRKVKAPRVSIEPLEPVSIDDLEKMLATCKGSDFYNVRDRAVMLFLYDTGARASEFCSVNLEDCNQITGEVMIRQGKGRKPRSVFLGKKTRKALRNYLKQLPEGEGLWLNGSGERLTYWGLDEIVSRRSIIAGIAKPELHSFRRAFALNMLRAGVDLESIAKLMGHADLQVLKRYLKQSTEDLRQAHAKGSPVDNQIKG